LRSNTNDYVRQNSLYWLKK